MVKQIRFELIKEALQEELTWRRPSRCLMLADSRQTYAFIKALFKEKGQMLEDDNDLVRMVPSRVRDGPLTLGWCLTEMFCGTEQGIEIELRELETNGKRIWISFYRDSTSSSFVHGRLSSSISKFESDLFSSTVG
ncbi:hypothetical protein Tco_0071972 [Tanacetum coccineum]